MARRKAEKAKDFKSAIKRLLKELSSFKVLIIVSLVLALLGSVLSICTPNILSKLTDTISEGLIVNKDNLNIIQDNIKSSLTEEKMMSVISKLFIIDKNKISDLNKEDMEYISKINNGEYNYLFMISNDGLNKLLISSDNISVLDKIAFINGIKNKKIYVPDSISSLLFEDFTVDGVVITAAEQALMINLLNNSDSNEMLSKIDGLSDNLKKVIEPKMNLDKIKRISLVLITMYLVSAIFTYIESISMTDVSNKFAKKLRSSISIKINKLPLKYFDRSRAGDTLSRVTNDVDTIAQSMNHSLATLVSASTLFIGSIVMMFVTNYIMAFTAILSSMIGFVFMFMILGKSQKYFEAKQRELGNLNGHIEEIYSGLNVVKVYNGTKDAEETFDKLNNKLFDANRKSQFLSGLMHPIMGFIGNFGYVAVCIVGALLTMNNKISFGVIVAFISYVRLFTSPLSQIAQSMTNIQTTAAASERVFEFLDEKEMPVENKNIKVLDKNKVKGNIEFRDVVFKYPTKDTPTIKNFSAKAKTGEKIAIVGPTGAGKTTIVNLLMKFYDIDSGEILIDGVSTKNLTRENIHDLFTMVLQDTWIYDGTIRENIIYNQENVSDDRVEDICKIVGLDHFIKTFPEGYDTMLTSNDSVSAGQKQLLTIARGMIKDAPFLILDEATSNVDTRTEELVQNAMDKLTEGKTSFIIAHRLSTIRNADLILVMKDGNIIEQGNHDELIKLNKFYAELYNSQFEL